MSAEPTSFAAEIAERHGWSCADEIMEMPEMQAIRRALRDMAEEIDREIGSVSIRGGAASVLAVEQGLPPSVVAWVLAPANS